MDASETELELELTYQDNVVPWLAVQLDCQYVVNPGTDSTRADVLVVGSRVTGTF